MRAMEALVTAPPALPGCALESCSPLICRTKPKMAGMTNLRGRARGGQISDIGQRLPAVLLSWAERLPDHLLVFQFLLVILHSLTQPRNPHILTHLPVCPSLNEGAGHRRVPEELRLGPRGGGLHGGGRVPRHDGSALRRERDVVEVGEEEGAAGAFGVDAVGKELEEGAVLPAWKGGWGW